MRSRILLAVAVGALAGCGSGSSQRSIGQVCGKYAKAVEQLVPPAVPPPVPKDLGARLGAQSSRVCVQQAVALGYARSAGSADGVSLTDSQAKRLLGELTAGTAVRVSP